MESRINSAHGFLRLERSRLLRLLSTLPTCPSRSRHSGFPRFCLFFLFHDSSQAAARKKTRSANRDLPTEADRKGAREAIGVQLYARKEWGEHLGTRCVLAGERKSMVRACLLPALSRRFAFSHGSSVVSVPSPLLFPACPVVAAASDKC